MFVLRNSLLHMRKDTESEFKYKITACPVSRPEILYQKHLMTSWGQEMGFGSFKTKGAGPIDLPAQRSKQVLWEHKEERMKQTNEPKTLWSGLRKLHKFWHYFHSENASDWSIDSVCEEIQWRGKQQVFSSGPEYPCERSVNIAYHWGLPAICLLTNSWLPIAKGRSSQWPMTKICLPMTESCMPQDQRLFVP